MITTFYWIFGISLFLIFYSYIGYGCLIATIVGLKSIASRSFPKTKGKTSKEYPRVTLVVAAYNEEDFIQRKIENTLSLNYPRNKLNIIFVTDGSTDQTVQILRNNPRIKLLHSPDRLGKTAALNRAMKIVKTPITIFCDANTILCKDAVLHIVSHYNDPRTGGVAGEKRVATEKQGDSKAANEGLYWKYESILKWLDAKLYTVVGAAGELFSIRTSLWQPLDHNIILDDFIISLRINLKGYRIAYSPEAYAMERPSQAIKEEKKRKIRIAAGAFQAMRLVRPAFNFFKYPLLSFQLISHRFLRWVLVPLCIPLLFASNMALLWVSERSITFTVFMTIQLLFYLLVIIGNSNKGSKFLKPAKICYYIFFMNYTVYLGFLRYVRGTQSAIWEKAKRDTPMKYNRQPYHQSVS